MQILVGGVAAVAEAADVLPAGAAAFGEFSKVVVFVWPCEGHLAEFESGAQEKVVGKYGGRWKPALPVELAAAGSAVVALPHNL